MAEMSNRDALELWHDVIMNQVSQGAHDLSMRQFAILFTVYLEVGPHTVRGLAAKLSVTKPVITRALDAMSQLDLLARKRDQNDKRNVLVQRTVAGALYVENYGDLIIRSAKN
ncbi:MAG: MarR family transcriptional regulator [Hyphomicrobiales bacterium]|nr:MAG: MarR family transcriptional regulator [Hyphomicrobiales bacterium]